MSNNVPIKESPKGFEALEKLRKSVFDFQQIVAEAKKTPIIDKIQLIRLQQLIRRSHHG